MENEIKFREKTEKKEENKEKYMIDQNDLVAGSMVDFGDKEINELCEVFKNSWDASWLYDDMQEFVKEMIENPENIIIVLKDGDRIVGSAILRPHNDVVDEIIEDDPEITPDDRRYYIETLGIRSDYQGKKGGFKKIVNSLINEVLKRGTNKFSMHARISTGLAGFILREFKGMITKQRKIEKWKYYGGNEPTLYIEGTFK